MDIQQFAYSLRILSDIAMVAILGAAAISVIRTNAAKRKTISAAQAQIDKVKAALQAGPQIELNADESDDDTLVSRVTESVAARVMQLADERRAERERAKAELRNNSSFTFCGCCGEAVIESFSGTGTSLYFETNPSCIGDVNVLIGHTCPGAEEYAEDAVTTA